MSHAAPPAAMPLRCREEAIEAKGRLMAAMSVAHDDQVDMRKAELACQKRRRMDVKALEASKQLDMEVQIKDLKRGERHLERANQELTDDNLARKSSRQKAHVGHVRLKDLYVKLAAKQDRMDAKSAKAAAGYVMVNLQLGNWLGGADGRHGDESRVSAYRLTGGRQGSRTRSHISPSGISEGYLRPRGSLSGWTESGRLILS